MRLLVVGKTGQVARELARHCPPDCSIRFLDRHQADLSDPAACKNAIMQADVDAVINAAAWTAVDDAETSEVLATVVNGVAPGEMAAACAQKDIPFLHISTDYVFDGSGTLPFAPDHPTAPLSAYGRSKLAGETAIRATGAHHLILRTSWVFSGHGRNFVTTMLRLGAERAELRVIADQIGGPTPASDIARALFVAARGMIAGQPGGTHHFSGAPDVSWATFARQIMADAGLHCMVHDIASSEYPTLAVRPLNSRLECASLTSAFGIQRPDWRLALKDIILNLGDDT
ncbi:MULTISPECIES: dTDP-4-dehydrorhamnose reductase [unclassified Yoonia]|uniref:dTDP-4-dehydrorhamnose reductase n=1 Tax=unclassified Yoonia TaxID=2629118 RepID=UPI002AFE4903|nr:MULTISPECIES: dTDP-4-dehydrorhamnose reductase [unclassified Yoonia]